MAQMMLMTVLLLVSSNVVVDADQSSQTDTANDCPTCKSATEDQDFDKVSLLTVKTHLTLGKDKGKDGVSIDSKPVHAAVDDADGWGTCDTPKCNAEKCPNSVGAGAAMPDYGESISKGKANGPFCFKAFGVHECCREDYEGGIYFRRSANRVDEGEDPCAGCTDLTRIAPLPVTLYVQRHGEGLHNLKSDTLSLHTYKTFGEYDAPLSDNGVLQAEQARPHVQGIDGINMFLVSPLRRAQQTLMAAKERTQYEHVPAYVAPYVIETGRGKTNENTANAPDFQLCLMDRDPATNALHTVIHRCVAYDLGAIVNNQAPGTNYRSSTCSDKADENGQYKDYTTEVHVSKPQDFADWLTIKFPGQKVFLTGHSNAAKAMGIMQADGETKINWAGIYEVFVTPGEDVKLAGARATEIYLGTSKDAGSTAEHVQDNNRAAADLAVVAQCKAQNIPGGQLGF